MNVFQGSCSRVQELTPLLAGNNCVTLLASVSADPTHTMDTNNTLRLVRRAQHIGNQVSCIHVNAHDIDFPNIWSMLPAEVCAYPHRKRAAIHQRRHACGIWCTFLPQAGAVAHTLSGRLIYFERGAAKASAHIASLRPAVQPSLLHT